jgi:hypothetical protein
MERHRSIEMANLYLKWLETSMLFHGSMWRGKRAKKARSLQRTCHLRSSWFSSNTHPIGKNVEKGVFKSTIGLLLDIPGKTKDGLSAHKDLQSFETREELYLQERANGKAYLSPASYTLTSEEKRVICKCLHRIRVPTRFSTNIKNMVSMSELKMSDYNTHDCHTMLSLFLGIAIRAINHPYLKMVITSMCHFINAISKKVIGVSELDELRKEIRVTMCQLEMCFPPSVFDTMEHYMIHLAFQTFVLGPSYMHYMYPYECHMVVMKGYVCNHAHP